MLHSDLFWNGRILRYVHHGVNCLFVYCTLVQDCTECCADAGVPGGREEEGSGDWRLMTLRGAVENDRLAKRRRHSHSIPPASQSLGATTPEAMPVPGPCDTRNRPSPVVPAPVQRARYKRITCTKVQIPSSSRAPSGFSSPDTYLPFQGLTPDENGARDPEFIPPDHLSQPAGLPHPETCILRKDTDARTRTGQESIEQISPDPRTRNYVSSDISETRKSHETSMSCLAVRLLPVANSEDTYHAQAVVNLVEHAVGADPDSPVPSRTLEFAAARRARIAAESPDLLNDSGEKIRLQASQIFLCLLFEQDLIHVKPGLRGSPRASGISAASDEAP